MARDCTAEGSSGGSRSGGFGSKPSGGFGGGFKKDGEGGGRGGKDPHYLLEGGRREICYFLWKRTCKDSTMYFALQ